MKKFTYWSNRTKWHEKEIVSIWTTDILAADVLFQEHTGGKNPMVTPWISVTIEENKNEQEGLTPCSS